MRWTTRPGWPGNLLAVAAGAITTFALAPFNIWPLALLAVGLFYAGLRELKPRQALGRGWCFGFGLFGAGTSWIYYSIHHFGGASVLLAGFLMLLFTAAIAFSSPCPPGSGRAGCAAMKHRWPMRWRLPHCGSARKPFAAGSSPVSRGSTPATVSSMARWPGSRRSAACGWYRSFWR